MKDLKKIILSKKDDDMIAIFNAMCQRVDEKDCDIADLNLKISDMEREIDRLKTLNQMFGSGIESDLIDYDTLRFYAENLEKFDKKPNLHRLQMKLMFIKTRAKMYNLECKTKTVDDCKKSLSLINNYEKELNQWTELELKK